VCLQLKSVVSRLQQEAAELKERLSKQDEEVSSWVCSVTFGQTFVKPAYDRVLVEQTWRTAVRKAMKRSSYELYFELHYTQSYAMQTCSTTR